MKLYKQAYIVQKRSAAERGIDFNLTFDEWHTWWEQSGHLYERGRQLNQYCMARFNDKGPYKLGNIKCITMEENINESRIETQIYNKINGIKLPTHEEKRELKIIEAEAEIAELLKHFPYTIIYDNDLLPPRPKNGSRAGYRWCRELSKAVGGRRNEWTQYKDPRTSELVYCFRNEVSVLMFKEWIGL